MKKILLFLLTLLNINVVFSQDLKVKQEIPDPMGFISNFDNIRFLDERKFSLEEEKEYSDFQNKVISSLKVTPIDEMYEYFGFWRFENFSAVDYLGCCLQTAEIGWGAGEYAVVELYGPVGPWEIYSYGKYYLTSFSSMGGIAPLLLMNFVEDRLYFYTLEGSTWKLLIYHKGGEIYLKKVLPSS